MSRLKLVEQSTAPDTPGTNEVVVYANTSGEICTKNDAGTVRTYAAGDVATTHSAAQTFTNEINVRQHTSLEAWSIDIANGTTLTLPQDTPFQFSAVPAFQGLVIVGDAGSGGAGMFLCGGGAVVEIADTLNLFSTSSATDNSTNVYWDGSSQYLMNNTHAAGRVYSIFTIRLRASS
jgi:redox-sensitive bicupin YhaK (pirin superfamily)